MKILFAAVLLIFLTGCVNKINLTVDSQPPGAEIYEQGKYVGLAPVDIIYPVSFFKWLTGSVGTTSLSANWKSGAKTSSDYWVYVGLTEKQTFSLNRPDHPDLDKDIEFGNMLVARRDADAAAERRRAAAEKERQEEIERQVYLATAPQRAAANADLAYSFGYLMGILLVR